MGRFLATLAALMTLVSNPGLALASTETLSPMEIINIPNELHALKLEFNEASVSTQKNLSNISKGNESSDQSTLMHKKQIKNKLCSLNRKFGPLGLGLKVNPLNISSCGLMVNLDLMRSYEILSSKPSFAELTEAFRPEPNQHFIDPTVLSILGKTLVSINDKINPLANQELKVQ